MLGSNAGRPLIFLRLQLAEKKVLIAGGNLGMYHGLHVSALLPRSVDQLVRDLGKPFLLDPMSYMLALPRRSQLDESQERLKPSIRALSERHAPLVGQILAQRSLEPSDLIDAPSLVSEIAQNVLDYQRTRFLGQPRLFNVYYDKYALWEDEEVQEPVPSSMMPAVLVPPYFYFNRVGDPWYQVSLRFAEKSLELRRPGESVWPVLLIPSRSVANSNEMARIVGDYGSRGFDGVLIWINNFSEEREHSIDKHEGLVWLVSQLTLAGKPVFKLFGGYFSASLYPLGLLGFSCGLGYGSAKNAFAYGRGRGPAQPNYYIPRLHRAVSLKSAEQLLRSYPSLRCSCKICVGTFGTDMDRFAQMAKHGLCQSHFLNVRHEELKKIAEHGLEQVSAEVEDTIAELSSTRMTDIGHLEVWDRVLKKQLAT